MMLAVIAFIFGLFLVATNKKPLEVVGIIMIAASAGLIAIGVLMSVLPLLVLVVFPLALIYALYKVLK